MTISKSKDALAGLADSLKELETVVMRLKAERDLLLAHREQSYRLGLEEGLRRRDAAANNHVVNRYAAAFLDWCPQCTYISKGGIAKCLCACHAFDPGTYGDFRVKQDKEDRLTE